MFYVHSSRLRMFFYNTLFDRIKNEANNIGIEPCIVRCTLNSKILVADIGESTAKVLLTPKTAHTKKV